MLLFALLASLFIYSDSYLVELRKSYYDAVANAAKTEAFFKKASAFGEQATPIQSAYLGMAYMLKARDAYNPYSKLAHFNKGKSMLENSIGKKPNDIELRFLRFTIQTNAPFFLAYTDNIQHDKNFIVSNWATVVDQDLKNRIKTFMAASDACTASERALFVD